MLSTNLMRDMKTFRTFEVVFQMPMCAPEVSLGLNKNPLRLKSTAVKLHLYSLFLKNHLYVFALLSQLSISRKKLLGIHPPLH